jgi:hypothetical protein
MDKPQLIEEINKLPEGVPFLKAKDDEGNGYTWVSDFAIGYIHRSEEDSYEVDSVISEDEAEEEFTPEEIARDLKKVVVIY